MAEAEGKRRVNAKQVTLVYVALVALSITGYLLSRGNLHSWLLPAVLLVAIVQMGLGVAYYMHYIEDVGGVRIVLPVVLIYVLLLLGITMLDVVSRYPPVNAPGPREQTLPPTRPAAIRSWRQAGERKQVNRQASGG